MWPRGLKGLKTMQFLRQLFATPSTNPQTFDAALAPLRATLLDENRLFSGSAMHQELQALEAQALGLAAHSPQRGWLFETFTRLQTKRGDTESVLHYGALALHIHGEQPFLDAESHFYLHYRMACAADEEGQATLAVQQLQSALDCPQGPWLTAAQTLALREKLGYLLHEAGQPAQALACNTRLLHDAQLHYGHLPHVLCSLLNNLAQNTYVLQQFGECQRYLQRRLALAQGAQDHATEADCLFQLGVVDCEQGDYAGARTWFDLRVQRARSLNDPELIDTALQAQQELIARIRSTDAPRP